MGRHGGLELGDEEEEPDDARDEEQAPRGREGPRRGPPDVAERLEGLGREGVEAEGEEGARREGDELVLALDDERRGRERDAAEAPAWK